MLIKTKMKNLFYLITLINFICFGQAKVKNDICWDGFIDNKIPIFIHYSIEDEVIIGEITYLNTKEKKPIKLIGTYNNKNSYRLLEFDKKGNITGVIMVIPNSSELKGTWVSTKTHKEMPLLAKKSKKVIISTDNNPNLNKIFGDYHYSYGNLLWNGDLSIEKDSAKNIFFELISLGKGEAPSIAQVKRSRIKLNRNSFIYKMPDSQNCRLKIIFFKDFVFVKNLGGDCSSEFGMGAYPEGIYLKITNTY